MKKSLLKKMPLLLSALFILCVITQESIAQTTTSCKVQEATYNKTVKAEEKALSKLEKATATHESKLAALKTAYDNKIAAIDEKIKQLPLSSSVSALKCGAGFFDKKATFATKGLLGAIGGFLGLGGNEQRCISAAERIANQKKKLEAAKVKAKTDYDNKVKIAESKLAAVDAKAKSATEKKVKADAELTACKAGGATA